MTTTTYTFNPHADLVELMGEDGPYTREAYTVACVASDGRRWFYIGPAEIPTAERAEAMADLMTRRAAQRPGWWPQSDWWAVGPTVYGSTAYVAQGGDTAAHADIEPELVAGTEEAKERAARQRDEEVAARRRPWGNF